MLKNPADNKFKVTFYGTRGSISTPGCHTLKYGGNTPCIYVQFGNDALVLDAGTGIRPLGLDIAAQISEYGPAPQHILLSHTHWDHIQGLPFFAPAYMKGCELLIYGSPQKESFLASILKGQMSNNYFPVKMEDLAATISIREVSNRTITVGAIKVSIQEQLCHPGGSIRFKMEAAGKKIIYATDVELNTIFQNPDNSPERERMANQYREFIHGADLLIADGQYTDEEYKNKSGWGHTSIPLIMQIAREEMVKQLVITHHDPEHSDRFIDELQHQYEPMYRNAEPPLKVLWAMEQSSITV